MLNSQNYIPLAEKMRPKSLNQIIGQDHIIGQNGSLKPIINAKQITSIILWGPPGSGKTTIAQLLAENANAHIITASATLIGVAELRKIFAQAEKNTQNTCLFIDEIHHFNKTQQDAFLPFVEKGTIILIGATTENPSFELNAALMSRCRVVILKRLDNDACETILKRAETFMKKALPLQQQAREQLIAMCDGDGRYLLNLAESLYDADPEQPLNSTQLADTLQKRAPIYDKKDESHYNLISALHKSLRASDCDASLYWLARMLNAGEDPHYILRRLYRFAYEDIGLADPNAAIQALTAWQYYERVGSPEGEIACVHLVVYLATAPKSNAVYKAAKVSMSAAKAHGSLSPPKHILNAPTRFMKDIGYGRGYQYDHDSQNAFSGQNCFPDDLPREVYYTPNPRGFERDIAKRLEYWQKLRNKKQK